MPSSGDGRVTVLELWLATDSAAEAADVEKALTRLQLRSYPDILALSQAFMTYSQMYEQCKADQIEACSQYTKMYLAVQVWALCNIARSANLAACHRGVMPAEPAPFWPTARSMSSARSTRLRPASSTAECFLYLLLSPVFAACTLVMMAPHVGITPCSSRMVKQDGRVAASMCTTTVLFHYVEHRIVAQAQQECLHHKMVCLKHM